MSKSFYYIPNACLVVSVIMKLITTNYILIEVVMKMVVQNERTIKPLNSWQSKELKELCCMGMGQLHPRVDKLNLVDMSSSSISINSPAPRRLYVSAILVVVTPARFDATKITSSSQLYPADHLLAAPNSPNLRKIVTTLSI